MQVAELLAFGGAARCAVLGVEIDDNNLAGLGRQAESLAAGGRQGEVGDFLSSMQITLCWLIEAIVGKSGRAVNR
jgi:hypothetical protein